MTTLVDDTSTSISARLAAITRAAEVLCGGARGRELMQQLLDATATIIPADAHAIWRYDAGQHQWQMAAGRGLRHPEVEQVQTDHGESMRLDEPFLLTDLYTPELQQRRAFYEREQFCETLVIPLRIRDEAASTIACYFRKHGEHATIDLELARVLAAITTALTAPKFDRFADAARAVSAELDLHKLVQIVTDAATEMTGAQFGAFFYNVVDQAGESYMLYTIAGVPREAFAKFPMPRNTAVFEPTFSGTATIRSANIRKDSRYGHNPPHHGQPPGHLPVVSYLAVPVKSRSGQVVGGLFFGHEEEGVFGEAEEHVAEALAAHAAIGIDNARLYDALQRERERLARNEARYRALVFAAPSQQAIWVANADGTLNDDNSQWRAVTGQTREQTMNWGWIDAIHPADRERTAQTWRDAVENRTTYDTTYRLRVADGSYRWFAARGVPVLDEKNEIVEWVGTVIDVHDKKTNDDGLRFLAKASDLFASSLDYETTLASLAHLAVPEIADWCAVDIVDEESGALRRLAVAHADPEKVTLAEDYRRRYPPNPETDAVFNVIRTGQPQFVREITPAMLDTIADPEQREILRNLGIVSLMIVPLRARGRVLGAVMFVSSDSGRRFSSADVELAEEFARRASIAIDNARLFRDAQAANRAKDEFLATLSHELRTPLTAVVGWARMMKMGLSPEEMTEAIDAIEKSASAQTQLIEDILDMSRIMAGKLSLESDRVDLSAIAEAAITTVQPSAATQRVEIVTSFPRTLPPVAGDETRLRQVIWNLLTNAIKFTPPGGSVLLRVAQNDKTVKLSVRDTGKGISPSFLPHVFEPFRQQDSSSTRAYGGIGLGLAISRYIVELHGGRITAESEGEGRGAVFTVELPVLPPERAGTTARVHVPPTIELPPLDGISVLVIDDQSYTRDVIAAILRRANAIVSVASSARGGLEAIAERMPNVIVCDIAMPEEDGYAFVRRLRQLEPPMNAIPVVALTAFGRPEDRENALREGFNAYMKKPVEPAQLAEVVRNAARA
ncbi:MAG TPA: GAF domain-containing protein [Thermoanaerobaculia bacterium]|nr:GAF domain-containing protein [Thermoanaerobaculia bacterium]